MATFTLSKDVNFQLGGFEYSAQAGTVTCPDDMFQEIQSLIGASFISGVTYDRDGLVGVAVTGTPTTGQILTASSSVAATWATPASVPLGLTGATAATRFVGATTGGAPTTGTFIVGDFVVAHNGVIWVCTTAGTPGTWASGARYADRMEALVPLVWWRLGEASGSTAVDASGNGYDGTHNGSGTLGATGLLSGDPNTAWTGNGTDASITGPTIPAQSVWTLLWWQKSNGANADYAGMFSTPGDQIDVVRVLAGPTGQLYFYDGTWSGGAAFAVGTVPTMVALTFDGTDLRTYINGVQTDATWTSRGRALNNAAFTVGALGGTETIDTMDEFAIFGRALSLGEIRKLYNTGIGA